MRKCQCALCVNLDAQAKDAARYRWLRDQGRDSRMEMVNNTDHDMDIFIDEQIAKDQP